MAGHDSVKVLVLVSLLLILDNAYVCLCRNGNSSSICFEEERNALLQLRQSLSDPSHVLSSWNGEDCCRWIGVTCNRANGHVVKLQITSVYEYPFPPEEEIWFSSEYDYSLDDYSSQRVFSKAGELNPSLLNLRYLSYLDLSGIFFETAYMPKFIGSMKQLRYLDLSNSFNFAIVPREWGNLTELEVLDLHGYYGAGVVDDFQWLSHLQALKYLDMSGIHINKSGDLMQVISALPTLSHLSLSNCGLYNFHPSSNCLANSTTLHLEYLDLSANLFKGPIPSIPFQNMTSLRHLHLMSNYFNSVPRWFDNLRSLVDLNLAYNLLQSIEGGLFSFLREKPFLKSLHLDYNELHEDIFLVEGSSSGLIGKNFERLGISSNFLQGTLPDWLFHLKNLTVLDLSYNQLHGTIPSPYDWLCLRLLLLSDNQLTGNIPDAFGRLQALSILDLRNNLLNGTIPQSLGQLQYLFSLDLSANSLGGTVSQIHFSNLSKLQFLDISNNLLAIEVDSDWIPPFNLRVMWMGSCKFGTEFPRWIRMQANLMEIDLSNASILGSLPNWQGLMSLSYLNLSHNQISGSLSKFLWLDLSHSQTNGPLSEMPYALTLDLSHNQINGSLSIFPWLDLSPNQINRPPLKKFYDLYLDISHNQINSLDLSRNQINGSLSKFLFPLSSLDLSHNLISRPIPQDIGLVMRWLETLNLNDNLLSGPIPTSICKMEFLYDLHLGRNELVGEIPACWKESPLANLDLSSNKLYGVIPNSLGNLIGLVSLHLNNNSLHGEIPMTLNYCRHLQILDLGENKISGSVPHWIGPSFRLLQILRLRENMFNGSIPSQLCLLSALQILDMAVNNLTGTIPNCLGYMKGMKQNKSIDEGNSLSPAYAAAPPMLGPIVATLAPTTATPPMDWTQEHVEQVVKGMDLDYTTLDLQLMVNLDLSSNKLVGPIPRKLTLLSGLRGLNLSRNFLSGGIPTMIGDMRLLESLDLSNNHLSGTIPQSFSAFISLSKLNLSHNNFMGPIPKGNQIQTLDDPSIYADNPLLCGDPLQKKCPEAKAPQVPEEVANEEGKLEKVMFYIVIMLGFATGFWGVVGSLVYKKNWRQVYFNFVDRKANMVYVIVAVKAAGLRRRLRRV
ncbi:hypothetical protein ACJRO7_006162 [Eucalyptus globulus]|uniref:Leucine-rich repeat-containing N-terminal plant-type domain-containing protein n=1 Tax=Eucalyptus globulus TaxID=34317 RepID=A0ABD3IHL1_EUCGL